MWSSPFLFFYCHFFKHRFVFCVWEMIFSIICYIFSVIYVLCFYFIINFLQVIQLMLDAELEYVAATENRKIFW